MQEQQFMVLIYITSSMCRIYGNVEIAEGQTRVFGLYYFESVANLALVFKLLRLLWARQAVRIQHKLSFSIHAAQSLLWVKKHFLLRVRKTAAHVCVWMESLGKVNMLHGRYILQLIHWPQERHTTSQWTPWWLARCHPASWSDLKGIVRSKIKTCWTFTHAQTIRSFVCS